MTPALHDALTVQRRHTDDVQQRNGRIIPLVFHREGRPIKAFRRAWMSACRRAGIPDRIPHDFRRTAVRNLELAGVSRSVAMKMVGHKTESIYRRYAIVNETDLAEAAQKLAALEQGAIVKVFCSCFPTRASPKGARERVGATVSATTWQTCSRPYTPYASLA
jgi:integrase